MRTRTECLLKAVEMEKRAATCLLPLDREAYLRLARGWREVSLQDAWQAAWSPRP